MLTLEDVLNRTARGVVAREQEMHRTLLAELELPHFKELWDTVQHHIAAEADKGRYYVTLDRELLGDMLPSQCNKIFAVLHSSGFKCDKQRNSITITWAEHSLSTDRREMLYRVKYGSILP